MDIISTLVLLTIGAIMIILFIKLFFTPLRLFFKLLLNTGIGFLMLIVVNYIGKFFGIHLGVNMVNALIVGILGLPGVALLLLLRWLMIF